MSDRTLRLIGAAVALAGVGVAGYLTWAHYSNATVVCVRGGGCETVQQSSYAEIAGVKVLDPTPEIYLTTDERRRALGPPRWTQPGLHRRRQSVVS